MGQNMASVIRQRLNPFFRYRAGLRASHSPEISRRPRGNARPICDSKHISKLSTLSGSRRLGAFSLCRRWTRSLCYSLARTIQVSVYCIDLELTNVDETDTPGFCLGLSVDFPFSFFIFYFSHGMRLSTLGTAATNGMAYCTRPRW
jgi:hypothetical protein